MQNIDFLFVEPGVTGIAYPQSNDVTLIKSKHACVMRFFRKARLLTDRTEISVLMHMLNTRQVSGGWEQLLTSDIRFKTTSTHPAGWQWRMIANSYTEFSYQTISSVILPACSGSLICVGFALVISMVLVMSLFIPALPSRSLGSIQRRDVSTFLTPAIFLIHDPLRTISLPIPSNGG